MYSAALRNGQLHCTNKRKLPLLWTRAQFIIRALTFCFSESRAHDVVTTKFSQPISVHDSCCREPPVCDNEICPNYYISPQRNGKKKKIKLFSICDIWTLVHTTNEWMVWFESCNCCLLKNVNAIDVAPLEVVSAQSQKLRLFSG